MPHMPDGSAADDERIEELTTRLDKLETLAHQQQQTIEQLRESSTLGTWGRRGVLGSIAVALGLASASGSAAAGVGDVGTASERVDAFLDQADVNALEADSGTVDGKDIPGYATSMSGDTSFGDWEQVSADRPARLSLDAFAKTDGTDNASIFVEIDESGGTTKDYGVLLVEVNASLGSNVFLRNSREMTLPAGSQYRVVNESDPTGSNTFVIERVFEL